jgi:hypothetical protein
LSSLPLLRWAVIALVMLTIKSHAQSPVKMLNQANAAEARKDYAECARISISIFESGFQESSVALGAAVCLALSGKLDEGFRYLNKSLDLGFPQFEVYEKDPKLSALRADARWPNFVARVKAFRAKLNEPLRAELLRMAEEDQAARNSGDPSAGDPQYEMRLGKIDERNEKRMREIISQFGWPGRSLVLEDGAGAAWLLVQHGSLPFEKECLPLLEASVKKGEAKAQDFAALIDRVLVKDGKKQLYGTQPKFSEDGGMVPLPIEDAANVDKRRKAIGLGTLAEYYDWLKESYAQFKQPATKKIN